MSNPDDFYRVEFWKPVGEGRITPTTRDDDAQIEMRIECFGRYGRQSMTLRRETDQPLRKFHYDLERIERLMKSAFDQGQYHRATIIKQALDVKL